jgi:hypothetical protein
MCGGEHTQMQGELQHLRISEQRCLQDTQSCSELKRQDISILMRRNCDYPEDLPVTFARTWMSTWQIPVTRLVATVGDIVPVLEN